ncbi:MULTISPECIES: thioredoxin-like domain-containing protein [Sporosarcina]|uniref:TlpA family protein disulfide reductase n=1 Tax=Sporosarcina contaminans TaxID=633403 RepID=A0ABW3U1I7_9BACL
MRLKEQMPELDGATAWLNGRRTKYDLIGRNPTLIHFWSISCHLCKEAMPVLNKFRDKYNNELNMIAVHMPRSKYDTDLEQIEDVAIEHNILHPIFVDNDLELTNVFDNQYVPAYYLFDKEGKLRHVQSGGSGMVMLEQRIIRLLNEPNR